MKRALLLLLVVLVASLGIWKVLELTPSVETKYKNKNPVLFARYDEARSLLDSWQGQQEILLNAYQILTEVVESDRDFAPAYMEFGRLYIMAGHINRDNSQPGSLPLSESAILKSIVIEPDYAEAHVLLGHLYTRMRRYEEAEAALEKGEEIGTTTPWLDLNWAELLNKQGKKEQAFQRYVAVVDSKTENRKAFSSAMEGIIAHYTAKGQYDKADAWYQKDLAYDPSSAWGWGNYASFLLFSRGDVEGAIKNAEKAISIMDYGMGRFILASALYTKWATAMQENGNGAEIQAIYERAFEIYPNLDNVIEETRKYASTRVTAKKLAEVKRNAVTKPSTQNS